MVRRPAVADASALAALYAAKASAEEDAADALLPALPVRRAGVPDARLLLVKGEPSAADVAAGEGPAGRDRDAVLKALEALVADGKLPTMPEGVLGIVTRPASRTDPAAAVERLARYLEACDPDLAIALDAVAARDLAAAAGLTALPFGEPAQVDGRTLLAVDGMEASLDDESRKRRVWSQLKALGEVKRPK